MYHEQSDQLTYILQYADKNISEIIHTSCIGLLYYNQMDISASKDSPGIEFQ